MRRTPLLAAAPVREHSDLACGLLLKLESLQVTGSFKARGAINAVFALPQERLRRGIVTASGGNHGLAVAYAGWAAGVPATIFLPRSARRREDRQARGMGRSRGRSPGEAWDDSNRAALATCRGRRARLYPPLRRSRASWPVRARSRSRSSTRHPNIDTLIVAIGGGGLIAGIAIAAKALKPGIRIIGVEPVGAPTLHDSLAAGRLVELAEPRRPPR